MREIGKLVMIAGLMLAASGFLIMTAGRTGLGRLPGDLVYRRGSVGCYFPLMTSILLSIALSVIVWLFARR